MTNDSNRELEAMSAQAGQEVPSHLQGLQVLAEGYQYYMAYLKDGGDDGISSVFGELSIDG